jgi:predicted DNA-binding protein (MmcQ/YjbR family)
MPKPKVDSPTPSVRKTAQEKMRKICLAFPDTKETITWGSPHYRVGDKIFSGIGDEKGKLTIGFKLQMDHAHAIVQDDRFWPSPYVGKHGWVSTEVTSRTNWKQIAAFVAESYGLIAPKAKRVARKSATTRPRPRPAR